MRTFLKTCNDPACPELVAAGEAYCDAHRNREETRAADRDIKARSSWRWVYKTRRWRGLRRQVLTEQPQCAIEGCWEWATDVDHILALQDGGGPFDRENVQGLCRRHHSAKTSAEVRARIRR